MIKQLRLELEDGTSRVIDVGLLDPKVAELILLSGKGNLLISSPAAKSINLESNKNIQIKPGTKGEINIAADHTGILNEVVINTLVEVDDKGIDLEDAKYVRCKLNSSELELNAKKSTTPGEYDLKFKSGNKNTHEDGAYCKTRLKGRSFDIRCYKHGGIALQPCGADSNGKENKIKFETSRLNDLNESALYSEEGGKGIEIFTMNSEHMSAWSGDYRFRSDSPIYAVTRGAVEPSGEDGDEKYDYPTLSDDFKDIIPEDQTGDNAVTWGDVIKAVKYLKGEGLIN